MAGAIAYITRGSDGERWRQFLEPALAPLDFRSLKNGLGNLDDIDVALAWKPDKDVLASLKNLKMVVSLGMGVDHLLADNRVPPGVAVTRIVDDGLIGQMSEYAIYWALHFHRDMDKYGVHEKAATWKVEPFVDTIDRRVGIMGLGTIGQDTAQKFKIMGFPTAGWSRSPKSVPGVESFHGADGLAKFLARTDILVNVLPLTRETHGILNARTLGALPRGSYLINMGRGGHTVDEDVIAALDSGQLNGAALDVFATEPLPQDHAFWAHPKLRVTPHIAGATNPRTAAAGVIENIKRVRSGQPLLNEVDPKTGY
jgi:glyoxylate/hydroxypyruvate reductase A